MHDTKSLANASRRHAPPASAVTPAINPFALESLERRTLLTAGGLDPTFGRGGIVTTDVIDRVHEYARGVAIQADGKVVVAGTAKEGGNDLVIARFNPGGTPDSGFGTGGTINADFGYDYASTTDVAIDSAGRIVASGQVDDGLLVARFLADGRLDTTFGTGGKTVLKGSFGAATPLALNKGGTILVAAARYDYSGYQVEVYRLGARGRLDTTFADKGVLRPVIPNTQSLFGVATAPDGGIVLMGETERISEPPVMFLARYTAAGAPDTSFAGSGLVNGGVFPPNSYMNALALTPQGKVLVSAKTDDGYAVARFRADGVFDRAFGQRGVTPISIPGPEYEASRLAVNAAGDIALVGRQATEADLQKRTLAVARLTAAGALDTSFDGDGIAFDSLTPDSSDFEAGFDIAFQGDGKVVVASQGDRALMALRYTAAGALDPTFGASGRATLASLGPTNQSLNALARLPDGRILAAGATGGAMLYSSGDNRAAAGLLVRYRADGALDTSFGNGGRVLSNLFPTHHSFSSVAVLPSGKFLVGGNLNAGGGFVVRYNADGRLDTTFAVGGKFTTAFEVRRLLALADGRVLIGTDRGGADALVCLTPDGAVASTFAGNADPVVDLLQQRDGKILVVLGDEVRRLNLDGSPDTTYGAAGTAKLVTEDNGPDEFKSLSPQAAALGPAGDLFITATQHIVPAANLMFGWSRYAAIHLTADGKTDTSFGDDGVASVQPGTAAQMEGGPTNIPTAIAVQPDGKVIVTGAALVEDYVGNALGTVRFNADGSLDHSFGDDGVVINRVGTNSFANAMLLADQKVVVGGSGEPGGVGDDFTLARYLLTDPAPLTGRIENRVLKVTGGAANDTIRLRVAPGQLLIRGVAQAFPLAAFSKIQIDGLAGDDTLDASASPVPVSLDGGAGNDSLLGGASADALLGSDGNDTLFGGNGPDTLRGGDGNDYLNGGPGADQLFGDAGNDQFFAVDATRDAIDGGIGFDRAKGDADDLLTSVEGVLA